MTKKFNVTGTCFPDRHYMVDISDRVAQIKKMVDDNDFFCINRGRQYGKTTTLNALKHALADDYEVYFISFEGLDLASYETDRHLAFAMMQQLQMAELERCNNVSEPVREIVSQIIRSNRQDQQIDLADLSMCIVRMCQAAHHPLVLIIDEVDQASNYDSFVRILGLLRNMYLRRDRLPTFQSVILAGVYDIKNLKLKIRPEAQHSYNSPWNIAAKFDVDMSLPVNGIEAMIAEYKQDHEGVPETEGMNPHDMAQLIYDYTSGYPFLVSRLCQILDEKKLQWDKEGFLTAVKFILVENNTLFDDMIKKLADFPDLSSTLQAILYEGQKLTYNPYNKILNLAQMFGYIRQDDNGKVVVSNRIFEISLYNYFSSKEESSKIYSSGSIDKNQFIKGGQIDMEQLISAFGEL